MTREGTHAGDGGDLCVQLHARALDVLAGLLATDEPCALIGFPYHANVGDSAIWLGERDLLRRLSVPISYTCDLDNFSEEALRVCLPTGTILIHGGGNLGDLWPARQVFRELVIAAFPDRRIIQLPQSIHFAERESLHRARAVFDAHPDLTICVRDRHSLGVARAQFAARTVLCPDMAFGLRDIPEIAETARYNIVWQARADHESAQRRLPAVGSDVLVTDWAEGQGDDPQWRSHARAAVERYEQALDDPDARSAACDRLAALQLRRGCDMLASGRVVITDRLHGHLLSLRLGLPHVVLRDRNAKIESTRETWTGGWPAARWAQSPAKALTLARDLIALIDRRGIDGDRARWPRPSPAVLDGGETRARPRSGLPSWSAS